MNWKKILKIGAKVIAAVVGGVAVFAGLSKLLGDDEPKEQPNLQEGNRLPQQQTGSFSESGQKLVNGLRMGQAAIAGTMGIISGVVSVATSINRVFDKNYYDRMLKDPYCNTGYVGQQLIPSPTDMNYSLPYGQPVYRGEDMMGGETCWIRRGKGVIEVW